MVKNSTASILCFAIGFFMNVSAQNAPSRSKNRDIVFTSVQPVKGNINSYGEETYGLIAPNGQLFFNRSFHHQNKGGEAGGQDIWVAAPTALPDSFAAASNNLPSLNSSKSNAVIGFGNNGNRLFLMHSQTVGKSVLPSISYSDWINNAWSAPVPMPLPGLSVASAFYSAHVFANGTKVILSMTGLPNSLGGYDLYITSVTDTGWSTPTPLPSVINTSGDEISPFFDEKNQRLFFASNAQEGAQGFDIFVTEPSSLNENTWLSPIRLPNTINSPKFDAYFSIINDSLAVFSSNRSSLLSDIFIASWHPTQADSSTSNTLTLRDTVFIYDTTATFKNNLAHGSLFPKEHVKKEPFNAIAYFDLNQKEYQKTFDLHLDSIADFLTLHKDIIIIVSGHTCSLGSALYNDTLSKLRAQYVMESLLRRGISADQISIRWFGATRPIQPNTSENNRKLNRRVELSFISK